MRQPGETEQCSPTACKPTTRARRSHNTKRQWVALRWHAPKGHCALTLALACGSCGALDRDRASASDSLRGATTSLLSSDAQSVTPALIILSGRGIQHTKLSSVVEPVVSTLVAGVHQYPRFDKIRLSYASVVARAPNISNATNVLTRRGDIFVWVGEAGRRLVPWAALRRKGVFSIFYQTEAENRGCALYRDAVDELWDFSWHNIEACRDHYSLHRRSLADVPTQRWVPLGALRVAHEVGHPQRSPPLFFLGA